MVWKSSNAATVWVKSTMPVNRSSRLKPFVCALFLALSMLKSAAPALGQERQTVGLELVLLIDVSASVSAREFRFQIDGLAAAFRSPVVLDAVQASGGIAVCVVQWAQRAHQFKSVEWMHLHNENDAQQFAGQIKSIARILPTGQTAIGNALVFALSELNTNPYRGLRRVIDLSGDGRSNDGVLLKQARTFVLQNDVTINGLAILNEVADLKQYFRDQLIGGPGAFVLAARDYSDFARAIHDKLAREIGSTPVVGTTNSSATINAQAEETRRFDSVSVR